MVEATLVLVTFVSLGKNTQHSQFKTEEVYLIHNFGSFLAGSKLERV